uniref:WD repeat-containing protein 55 homolog n=1 Tax=Megaselia scalaris TaxID=36166 RepID=T1GXC6_MEGSC
MFTGHHHVAIVSVQTGQYYASGSDQRFKIWKKEVEFDELVSLDLQYNFWNYFMCAKISRGKVFGGLYADVQQRRALREIDIETGNVDILHCNSSLKIKDDNILYTGHFDTTTRVFDRRTDTDEIIFIDPFDSSAYCIDHDGKYALLCGTKHHSRVNLYDIRVPNRVAQIYYPVRQKRKESSPVYSLCCDSRFLFIATDINLRVFDFKADWAKVKDYSNIISKW